MTRYYRKELPDRPVLLLGQAYRFDLMEADGALADALDQAASKRIGGVIKITEEDYLELKKNATLKPSLTKPRGREEVSKKLLPLQRSSARSAAVAVNEPAQPPAADTNYLPPLMKGIL